MKNRLLLVWLSSTLLIGCATQSRFAVTYKSPESGTSFVVAAPQRTNTPIYVDICSNGVWERAAILGQGLVSIGTGIIASDTTSFGKSPDAKALKGSAELIIPTSQEIMFRVKSNPELTRGSPISYGTTESCTAPATFKTTPGVVYFATWNRHLGGCSMNLIGTRNKVEEIVPRIEPAFSCKERDLR